MRRHLFPIIDPGRYDENLVFQTRPTVKSASGADVPGPPVVIATAHGAVTRVAGSGTGSEPLLTRTKYQVETYYIPNITKLVEIVWEGRTLTILDVPDLGPRPRNIIITAQERA